MSVWVLQAAPIWVQSFFLPLSSQVAFDEQGGAQRQVFCVKRRSGEVYKRLAASTTLPECYPKVVSESLGSLLAAPLRSRLPTSSQPGSLLLISAGSHLKTYPSVRLPGPAHPPPFALSASEPPVFLRARRNAKPPSLWRTHLVPRYLKFPRLVFLSLSAFPRPWRVAAIWQGGVAPQLILVPRRGGGVLKRRAGRCQSVNLVWLPHALDPAPERSLGPVKPQAKFSLKHQLGYCSEAPRGPVKSLA
ncbi:uncharacterized protein LOC118557061 [Fundulus heteroclitus]|uniref:uncharacterized protein LOC118557061 n=1 Tax=Fundulus heteroclitus TaxID=8078 RepID=UPI00165CA5D8|nr:uncharacterized protein LOC118557061 [Fundulus heteroclitus]